MKRLFVISFAILLAGMMVSCGTPEQPGGGDGITTVSVSGMLTGGFSTVWKIAVGTSKSNIYTFIGVSSVDGTGNFSVTVAKNSGTNLVFAFRDDNGNNVYETNEIMASTQPSVVIADNNIAGISIPIPIYGTVIVSGKLTGFFNSSWKIALGTYLSIVFPQIYGTVDLSGNYSITADYNLGSKIIFAFRDDNGNNIFDSSEVVSTNIKTVNITTDNITNISIYIPDFSVKSISGTVYGNTYGLPLGIYICNNDTGQTLYTAPSTSLNFTYNIDETLIGTNYLTIGYYIDDNGNGQFDGSPLNMVSESYCQLDSFSAFSNLSGLNYTLIPKMIQGSVTGSGAADMHSIIFMTYASVWASVSGGNYTIKYYTCAKGNTNLISISPDRIKITSKTGPFQIDAFSMLFLNNPEFIQQGGTHSAGNQYTPLTNTINYTVSKYSFYMKVTNSDAGLFKFGLLDSIDFVGMAYIFKGYDVNTVYDLYAAGSFSYSNTATFFIDKNGDNKSSYFMAKPSTEIFVLNPNVVFSGTGVMTNEIDVLKTVLNLTISGNLDGYVNPKVFASIYPGGSYQNTILPISQTANLYTIGSAGYEGVVFLFSDVNANGFFDTGVDSVISTNYHDWLNQVSSTNLTLYVTNHL